MHSFPHRSTALALLLALACASRSATKPALLPAPPVAAAHPVSCPLAPDPGLATSSWVFLDPTGHLGYKPLAQGDHIVDFSYAGYGGGGVALPDVPVKRTVPPSGADDTTAIQAAIDAVAQLPLEAGFRGAVLLGPGTFQLNDPLAISASGVVLRGSGSGAGGTLVNLGDRARGFLRIRGTGTWQTTGTPVRITDAYVPSGARTFHVSDVRSLSVGDAILIERPITADWIAFMGMDKLVRNGKAQTWLRPDSAVRSDRVIQAIDKDQITIDAPLTDSLDTKYLTPPGVTVSRYTFPGRLEQVGLERLRVVAPPASRRGLFLSMGAVKDAWVKDVAFTDFWNGIQCAGTSKAVTFQDLKISRTVPGARAQPADISIDGQQILVQRSSSAVVSDVHFLITGSLTPGPIVFRDFTASGGTRDDSAPHQRWATGILYEAVNTPGAGLELQNRGYFGSGHGWSAGSSVLWNCSADQLLVQQPPGSQNWSIGCTGTQRIAAAPGNTQPEAQGAIDSPGKLVSPRSLYLAQLCQRLGPKALSNIGE
jgi:hypothetical protein